MTILGNSELEKISNHEFSLDFLRARLVQQIPDSPKEYSGSGCISQSEGGELELKLYCPVDSGDELFEEVGRGYSEPGQLIEAESYFSFEGVDVFGQVWTARNIWVSVDVSFPASGCIIRSKIKSIENRRTQPASSSLARKEIIVPGTYKVPFTDVQPNTKESGYSACTIDFGEGCTCKW
ncbi:hypothetical protein [Pseudomonas aeruginosa]|uniref:hypothetical protein n=1 Tax=Pseudomonas aeruginosa TaxID=287 RepID=UPI0032E37A14